MEKDKPVQEFRLADVAAQVVRSTTADGRSWLSIRSVRFYRDSNNNEKEISLLRVDDVPLARKLLQDAYLAVKGTPNGNKKESQE